jgi:hypothetical protein
MNPVTPLPSELQVCPPWSWEQVWNWYVSGVQGLAVPTLSWEFVKVFVAGGAIWRT